MAFSYVTDVGDGSTRSFVFSFEGQDEAYIRTEDIVAYVNGNEVTFTILSSNTLEFTEAPADGSEVLIRRVMPKNVPFTDFENGNNFGQTALNNSFLQMLYIVHELLDGYFPEGFTVREAVTYLEGLRSQSPDPSDPSSVVTFGSGDDRYVNKTGDSMQGELDMEDNAVRVRKAVSGDEPARKDELDTEISKRFSEDQATRVAFSDADANLQAQISDGAPLEASAFSPISWHDKSISNSVIIPDNKNAWSFGPTMSVAAGQSVTIGTGSYWTIANGDMV